MTSPSPLSTLLSTLDSLPHSLGSLILDLDFNVVAASGDMKEVDLLSESLIIKQIVGETKGVIDSGNVKSLGMNQDDNRLHHVMITYKTFQYGVEIKQNYVCVAKLAMMEE